MSAPQEPVGGVSDAPRSYRAAWIIAFLMGITTITLMRPCTRHIPEPPPAVGAFPEVQLLDATEAPWGSEQLEGRVYVVAFLSSRCVVEDGCSGVFSALGELQRFFTREKVPIWVVGITIDDHWTASSFQHWSEVAWQTLGSVRLLRGSVAEITAIVQGARALQSESTESGLADELGMPWSMGLILVDGEGQCRGFYETTSDGVDEVRHRAAHVYREKQS